MAPAALRGVLQFTTILFLAGSALLLFFIVLAGSKGDGNILNKWYWLSADTSSIDGAPYPITRWSMYGICGYEKGDSIKHPGKFISCTKNKADYPFDPKRNFKLSSDNTWDEFSSNKFYYETRFQFPFYLIALFFDVVAMFGSVLSIFSSIAWLITTISVCLTAIFSICAAALSTAAYVNGRHAFHANGADAYIHPTLYGFAWAIVFMALANIVLMFFGFCPKKKESSYKVKSSNKKSFARGGFKFGSGKKKTTEVADDKDASSFVRA